MIKDKNCTKCGAKITLPYLVKLCRCAGCRTEERRAYKSKIRRLRPWLLHYISARERCTLRCTTHWEHYGGRGIKFKLTIDEIKSAWERDCASKMTRPSIDRIDNDGNYEASNIRFVELSENSTKRLIELYARDRAKTTSGFGKNKTISGIRGVGYSKKRNKWHSVISVKGVRKYLGWFDDKFQAAEARRLAIEKYFGAAQ